MKKPKQKGSRWREALRYNLRPNGFQTIITISTTVIVFLTILFFTGSIYFRSGEMMRAEILQTNQQLINQVAENLEMYLEEMHNTSLLIEEQLSTQQRSEKKHEVFHVTHKLHPSVETVADFSATGRMRTASVDLTPKYNNYSERIWFTRAMMAKGEPTFSPPHVQNLFQEKRDWVITYSRQIEWFQGENYHSAVLLVDMNFKTFRRICNRVDLGESGYIFVVSPEGNFIYHPQKKVLYSEVESEDLDLAVGREDGGFTIERDGMDYAVNICSVDFANWKVVSVASTEEVRATVQDMWIFLGTMILFAILFAFFIAIQVARFITSPIRKLQFLMHQVENGALAIRAPERGAYEIRELSKSFNTMVEKICSLMDEVIEEKDLLRKSEIRALQAQINPHFLYNTLDSIVWLAETGKKEDVVTMVTSLASLLRLTISKGDAFLTVEEELRHAESYLVIQKIRYGDKFDFSIEADEDALRCRTVRIILQPLLENAIYHGIEPMEEKGMIRICVRKQGERLLMQVIDNGVGMDEATQRSILETNPEKSSGIGVKNVDERIRLCCGEEYGLRFYSRPGEGTTIEIWLPSQK